jgi:hypothetical protein
MKRHLNYVKSDIKLALDHLPTPKQFELMYGDGFMEGDLSNVPVKTLAEWLDIDMVQFPPADMLSEEQQQDMAQALLVYWDKKDELAFVIRCLNVPKRQYECALEYMTLQGRYNGLGGFKLENIPIPPEEFKKIISPLDRLTGLDLGSKESGLGDYKDGLPF